MTFNLYCKISYFDEKSIEKNLIQIKMQTGEENADFADMIHVFCHSGDLYYGKFILKICLESLAGKIVWENYLENYLE